LSFYQLDFTTPGISPFSAKDLKHKRQMPNLRRNPRGRPHNWQRLCLRQLNFGFRASFTLFAVVAINSFSAALSSQISARPCSIQFLAHSAHQVRLALAARSTQTS